MPLVGVICGNDGRRRSFAECLCSHADGTRTCDATEALLYSMSQEGERRKGVGVSATNLLSCAKSLALKEQFDYYEDVSSAWNKHRGSLIHAMIEYYSPPREGVIRERRVERHVVYDGVDILLSGQCDEIDVLRNLLVDYKSTHLVPKTVKESHTEQLNIYIWLLAGGVWQDTGEPSNITITKAGIHYVSFEPLIAKTKEKQKHWKKAVPVWDLERTEALVMERLAPIAQYRKSGILPECNAFTRYGKNWLCDCEIVEKQLIEEGILLG